MEIEPPPSIDSPVGRRLRLLAGALSILVALYLLGSLAVAALVLRYAGYPGKAKPVFPSTWMAPRTREVRFSTPDGVTLRGLYAPPEPGRPVLVLCHGIYNNREQVLPWGKPYARTGCGVLAFDWRAHGLSGGKKLGVGIGEPIDLEAALDWLASRPEARGAPLAILAVSLGAGCLAQAAPQLPEGVRCLVLDSPFGSITRMIDHFQGRLGWLLLPARWMLSGLARWTHDLKEEAIRPEEELAAFAPRPVLVFHGAEDPVIPQSEGRSLYRAYPGSKQSWFTEGHRHLEARVAAPREYLGRMASFLEEHLPGAPAAEMILADASEAWQGFREP